MAYTIKMTRKFDGAQDYTIGKLEAQWWADDGRCFSQLPPDQWRWKLLIRTPEFVADSERRQAVEKLKRRAKPRKPPK